MNPYDHARSSAALHGGTWQDYHAIHAWFDATKAAICHYSHRALRHHDRGVEVAVERFGAAIRNADGATVDVRALGAQHLAEDHPAAPAVSDWLVGYRSPDWMPRTVPTATQLAAASSRVFGAPAATLLPLHRWFLETAAWTGDQADMRHLLFRHHAFGCFEAEERFGPAIATPTGAVPTRVVAESHVRSVLKRIPPASEWLRHIAGEKWMRQATSPKALGLDRKAA